jgi:hypothetical protein
MPRSARALRYALALAIGLGLMSSGMLPAHAASVPTVPAIVIGGSAAAGWNDPLGHGYVERGLAAYGQAEGIRFAITNYGIRGAPTVDARVARMYPRWLHKLGPNGVVVLAWGMLNDLRLGTPPAASEIAIRRQISQALTNGDMVLVVTPPVTRLSVGKWRIPEADLVRMELNVAASFDSPRVRTVNAYFPELALWDSHHYNYRHFMYNGYDPNLHGYVLAGKILASVLEKSWNAGVAVPPRIGATAVAIR